MTAGILEAKRAIAEDLEAVRDLYGQLPSLDERLHASFERPVYAKEVKEALADVHCCLHDLYYELMVAEEALMDVLKRGVNR